MIITGHGDIVETLKFLVSQREYADASVRPFQKEGAVYGAFFLRLLPEHNVTVYGEILEPKYKEDREVFASPHMEHVRLTKCYSYLEPEGEYGNTHIATMALFLTKELFDLARDSGWPHLI